MSDDARDLPTCVTCRWMGCDLMFTVRVDCRDDDEPEDSDQDAKKQRCSWRYGFFCEEHAEAFIALHEESRREALNHGGHQDH